MAMNLLTPDVTHMLTAGIMDLNVGNMRTASFNSEYQQALTTGSMYSAIAQQEGIYYMANPVARHILTRNGNIFAQSRRMTVETLMNRPALVPDPVHEISSLLGGLSGNMSGPAFAQYFMILDDMNIQQESRIIQALGTGVATWLGVKMVHSPVKLLNTLYACAYCLAYHYPNTTWRVPATLSQVGGDPAQAGEPAYYELILPDRLRAALNTFHDIKREQTLADVAPKGVNATQDPKAAYLLADWLRVQLAEELRGQTVELNDAPSTWKAIRMLLEAVLAGRGIYDAPSVHAYVTQASAYASGPTMVDIDYYKSVYDATDVVYGSLPDFGTTKTYLAYRYMVRGGPNGAFTIGGTPRYRRVEYDRRADAFQIGGRAIQMVMPAIEPNGQIQPGQALEYGRMVVGGGGASNIRTMMGPDQAVVYDEIPLTLDLPTDEQATALVESRRINNESFSSTFWIARNWLPRQGLNNTPMGIMNAHLGAEVTAALNVPQDVLVPLSGGKLNEAMWKAESPLTDYTLKLKPDNSFRVVGYPTWWWNTDFQTFAAGKWDQSSLLLAEMGTRLTIGD